MLRKFIKSIIPSRGDIFYILFEESVNNAHLAAQIFVELLNSKDPIILDQLCGQSKTLKQKSNELNKKILQELSNMFITPIDRGDIQELSSILNKLTKRIVKISLKLKIYNIDANTDDCLIKTADTLFVMTEKLKQSVLGLKNNDSTLVANAKDAINELEENGIDDFKHAIDEIYSGKFDTLTILKLKEIYKSIDAAIELNVTAAELMMQIVLENI